MYIFFWFPGEELDEWIKVQNWTIKEDGKVFVSNQEAHIKSKNIAEKIDLDSELWWIIDSLEQMYQYSNIVDKAPSNFDFIRYIFPDKNSASSCHRQKRLLSRCYVLYLIFL